MFEKRYASHDSFVPKLAVTSKCNQSCCLGLRTSCEGQRIAMNAFQDVACEKSDKILFALFATLNNWADWEVAICTRR